MSSRESRNYNKLISPTIETPSTMSISSSISSISSNSNRSSRASSGRALGLSIPPRPKSTAEIQALLRRTTVALDRIVEIRQSMEDNGVNFDQFRTTSQHQRNGSSSLSINTSFPPDLHRKSSSNFSSGSSIIVASTNPQLQQSPVSRDSSLRSTESSCSGLSTSLDEENHSTRTNGIQVTNERQPSRHSSEEDMDSYHDTDIDNSEVHSTSSLIIEEENNTMSTYKEARLHRMTTIPMQFYEGLPIEFFQAMCRFLHEKVELKTRHARFSFYKDTFTGKDAIAQLVLSGFAEREEVAMRYGTVMVKLGYIEHISKTIEQLQNNKEAFYRFTKTLDYPADVINTSDGYASSEDSIRASIMTPDRSTQSARTTLRGTRVPQVVQPKPRLSQAPVQETPVEYDFDNASNQVLALVTIEALQVVAIVLNKVFHRTKKLMLYKGFDGCFLGSDAVVAILETRLAVSLIDAILIGQSLLDEGIIEPIVNTVDSFQNSCVFYRFTKK